MNPIAVGAHVPDFELKDQNGTTHRLSELRGTHVLLSFHPLAWTDLCRRQMEALELNLEAFESLNARAFGISVDPVPSKKAWADAIGIRRTSLLSDFWPHGAAASSFGIFREDDGFSERASILVDTEGIVRFAEVHPLGEVPDIGKLLDEIRTL